YWGYITLIDDAIGDFIDFLKDNNLYDNTFLVITADHGDAMGAHRMIEKGEFMFDTTYKIPMIVKDVNFKNKSEVNDNLIYLHDLTATAYDISGKEIPEEFECESILPIIRDNIN